MSARSRLAARCPDGSTGAPLLNPATGRPLVITVAVNAPLPYDDPPRDVRVMGLGGPIAVGTTLDSAAGAAPSVWFYDDTPSAYLVTWDFGADVVLVPGSDIPQRTVSMVSAGTYHFDNHLGVVFGLPLALAKEGVYPVSATVQEVPTAVIVRSIADDIAVAFDPYAGVSASGKGTLDLGAAKSARFDFSIAYKNGVATGKLDYASDGDGIKFHAETFDCVAASGSLAFSGGLGRLNGTRDAIFRLLVDGTANTFHLVIIPSGSTPVTYAVGPLAVDPASHGDIVVTVPPNG